ncbi:hypothetical protein [Psychromonas ossibalaenae]|uniref:hypothetical protein n=1 Tax=Psychromonas ossibalaenae TaxID=444922 RepID=UPI0003825476|nr:hypothetical protein [Psychromonas ossibalaenae]
MLGSSHLPGEDIVCIAPTVNPGKILTIAITETVKAVDKLPLSSSQNHQNTLTSDCYF